MALRDILWNASVFSFVAAGALAAPAGQALHAKEALDRGFIVVPAREGGNLLQWRLRAEDGEELRFNLFRDGVKLNGPPLKVTNFLDKAGTAASTYKIQAVGAGGGQGAIFAQAKVWGDGYLSIPLDPPAGGTTPDGVAYTYRAVDGSVGDVDGDGKLEIILKWDPSNSKDNSNSGYTGNVFIDAYSLEGQRLWRIDLGKNIRAGAHYTQFLVFDFDGDGRAEVVAKTADGTVDGQGRVIGDAAADFRTAKGYILSGPEYLTVFQGSTGRALSTVNYAPPRHPDTLTPTSDQLTALWGDGYGNRVDRFLATPAFLDGHRASIVMTRGYYRRSTLAAWDFIGGKLKPRWFFDSAAQAVPDDWTGQGNHSLATGDVDRDGKDEIIFGSMVVNDDGTGLWSGKNAGIKLGHGDALHFGDLVPDRPGLERFGVHESTGSNGGIVASMLDARTGEVIWTAPGTGDNGRGVCADLDPAYPGAECWSARSGGLRDAHGNVISASRPGQMNFRLYWDGDRQSELLDGISISKWNPSTQAVDLLLTMTGTVAGNSTKATPVLSGDILGDWREEVVMAAADHRSLRIYATPYPTEYRYRTLLADPVYRLALAWQNVGYNQPPHLSFDLESHKAD
ncbi:MAG: rhamnogalacturonan lyase [Luteolibacter sp.]